MTPTKRGHPFTVAAWILVVALVVAGIAGVLGDILSRSLVVDLAAMWPLLAVAVFVGSLVSWRGKSRRSGAVLPLAILTVLVLAGALHIGGWERLPSATARLAGPPATEMSQPTELVAQISGELEVEAKNGETAYRVDPILRGGAAGVPRATETSVDGDMSISLEAAEDSPAWYSFAGWQIGLNPNVTWRLVLNGDIDADLTALVLSSAAIAGSGSLRLGEPPDDVSVIVAGNFEVTVPAGSAVVVDGNANVPSSWEEVGGGFASPADSGEGAWRISVQGDATPTLREG